MIVGPVESTRFIMTTGAFPRLRRADLADAQAVADICNEAILSATARFDIEPKSVAEHTQWLRSRDERHRVPVAVVGGKVVGWASLTRSDEWQQGCQGRGILLTVREWEVRGPNPLSTLSAYYFEYQGPRLDERQCEVK